MRAGLGIGADPSPLTRADTNYARVNGAGDAVAMLDVQLRQVVRCNTNTEKSTADILQYNWLYACRIKLTTKPTHCNRAC